MLTRRRPGMAMRCIAMIGMATFALVSCGGSTGSAVASKAADGELRRAVEATLAAKTFMIHVRQKDAGVSTVSTTMFDAPDRLRTVTGDGTQTIIVGETMWTQPPAHGPIGTQETMAILHVAPDGPFARSAVPTDQPRPFDGAFGDLRRIATATQVEAVGDLRRYRAGTGPSAISGAVQIEDGRVTVWTIETADKAREQSGFVSRFDDVGPINPPALEHPADQPFPQACDPDGRPSRALCDIAALIPPGEGATNP
jgi:hypothetical protein